MFKFVVLVALFGMAVAAASEGAETKVLENVISPAGDKFHYAYQISNGIDVNSDGTADVISGSYKYISPEGQAVEVKYTSDLNGFQPQSPLLPTPPPIPAAIIRSLEWNAAHPQKQELSGRKL